MYTKGGAQHRGSILASHPAARVQFLTFPKIYLDVADTYPLHWLEGSGQKLENVEQTHLVQGSDKLVLQKRMYTILLWANFSVKAAIYESFKFYNQLVLI